jgi:hypothetical protein
MDHGHQFCQELPRERRENKGRRGRKDRRNKKERKKKKKRDKQKKKMKKTKKLEFQEIFLNPEENKQEALITPTYADLT